MNAQGLSPIPDWPIWQRVLDRYDIGQVLTASPGSGTAAPKVRVETSKGSYILRRRRSSASDLDIVAYDHALINALYQAGLPVVAPLPTTQEVTWVIEQGCAYELYSYLHDLTDFEPGNRCQIVAVARSLARFHAVTRHLTPGGRKDWTREHHIDTMRRALAGRLAAMTSDGQYTEPAKAMLQAANALGQQLDLQAIAALPTVIIHGDYTPANVSFRGNNVGGIFDFDWATRQTRLIDIGEAIIFFAFRRPGPIDPGDIWSLVQTWEPDMSCARYFLRAYQRHWPLGQAEAIMLPYIMQETWLGIRIRAMRKVPTEQQLEILAKGALSPLDWLEQHKETVTRWVIETQ